MPLKSGERKSRLSAVLTVAERARLSDRLAGGVLGALARSPQVGRTLVLSPECPSWPDAAWAQDRREGLNAELQRQHALLAGLPLLVIHADLPFLETDDIAALLVAAEEAGCAVAPDRHGTGTNAIALREAGDFAFAFGEDSFARHLAAWPGAAVVRRDGLAFDLDTPEDFDLARRRGLLLPSRGETSA